MLLMALSPAMSAILAFIFLDERIALLGIIGIFITISGIALVVLERNANSKYTITKLGIFYGILGAMGQAGGLIFAKFAFDACVEPRNYFKVNNVFDFTSSADELNDYISRR